MKTIGAVLVVAALATAPAVAQEHGHMQHGEDMPAMQGMEHCTAMMGGPAPAMILHHSEELDLSADQVSRLEALRDRARTTAHPHMTQAMQAHAAAAGHLEGDQPDFDAYEAALREAADHMVQSHTAMARAAVETRQVLTADQQARFSQVSHSMGGGMAGGEHGAMMGEHEGMGMMMHCMMMGGMGGMGTEDAGHSNH